MKYEPMVSESITTTDARMCAMAREHNATVTAEFNGIALTATVAATPGDVARYYHEESDRRAREYEASPEYRATCERARVEAAQKESARADILATAPAAMTLRDAATWQVYLDTNKDDGYGMATLRFAETWARMMEARIAQGVTLEDCADATSHLADAEGITGFMYGMAVNVLACVWTHGEALRVWHNTQYGRPNTDGVVNPAVLTIGTSAPVQ